MRTIIIDDEQRAQDVVSNMISKYAPMLKIVGYADGVQNGIEQIRALSPDLIFLDINMNDGDGFDLLEAFPNKTFKVIFVTAYDNFAVKAFRYNALDYVLKPIDVVEFKEVIEKVKLLDTHIDNDQLKTLIQALDSRKLDNLTIPSSDGISIMPISEIEFCEADKGYTSFYTVDGKCTISSKPLKHYEDMLPVEDFFRIHQSFLINMRYLKKYLKEDDGMVEMASKKRIHISRRNKDAFLKRMKQGV